MKTPEQIIKSQICEYLTMRRVWFYVPNNARVLRRHKYYRPGVSDIVGIFNGKPLYIEVKAPGRRPSDDQIQFVLEAKNQGAIAFVAFSVEDVVENLHLT